MVEVWGWPLSHLHLVLRLKICEVICPLNHTSTLTTHFHLVARSLKAQREDFTSLHFTSLHFTSASNKIQQVYNLIRSKEHLEHIVSTLGTASSYTTPASSQWNSGTCTRERAHSQQYEQGGWLLSWKPIVCSLKDRRRVNLSSRSPAPLRLFHHPHHMSSVRSLSNTFLHSFSTEKPPLFIAILNSHSYLLLVSSVVVLEPSSFILSHRKPMGTESHSSMCFLLSI
jgi:hypothetical protein